MMWRRILTIALASTSLASCGGSDVQPKSGHWTNAVRELDPFHKLSVSVPAEVRIQVGSKYLRLELSGDQAVVDAVSSEVKDGALTIDSKGKHLNLDGNVPLKITLSSPNLDALDVAGAAKFDIQGLNSDSFDMSATGACTAQARGHVTKLTITSSGASNLDFGKVECKDVKLIASGASNIKVDATESLDSDLSGASKLRYCGNPKKLEKKISGVSSIEEYSSY